MPRISWARFEYGLVAGPADAAGAAGVSAGPELGAEHPAAANATAITNEPILINLPSIRQRPGLRAPPEKRRDRHRWPLPRCADEPTGTAQRCAGNRHRTRRLGRVKAECTARISDGSRYRGPIRDDALWAAAGPCRRR